MMYISANFWSVILTENALQHATLKGFMENSCYKLKSYKQECTVCLEYWQYCSEVTETRGCGWCDNSHATEDEKQKWDPPIERLTVTTPSNLLPLSSHLRDKQRPPTYCTGSHRTVRWRGGSEWSCGRWHSAALRVREREREWGGGVGHSGRFVDGDLTPVARETTAADWLMMLEDVYCNTQ